MKKLEKKFTIMEYLAWQSSRTFC